MLLAEPSCRNTAMHCILTPIRTNGPSSVWVNHQRLATMRPTQVVSRQEWWRKCSPSLRVFFKPLVVIPCCLLGLTTSEGASDLPHLCHITPSVYLALSAPTSATIERACLCPLRPPYTMITLDRRRSELELRRWTITLVMVPVWTNFTILLIQALCHQVTPTSPLTTVPYS